MRPPKLKERILQYVERIPIAGCWIWTGQCTPNGYGQTNYNYGPFKNKHIGAHVASWIAHKGSVPNGVYVCHNCDVRICINPYHLFLGTATENMQDAKRKGRIKFAPHKGEANGRAVLTVEQVKKLREKYAKGATQKKLAVEFGIAQSQVSRIILKHQWKEMT